MMLVYDHQSGQNKGADTMMIADIGQTKRHDRHGFFISSMIKTKISSLMDGESVTSTANFRQRLQKVKSSVESSVLEAAFKMAQLRISSNTLEIKDYDIAIVALKS